LKREMKARKTKATRMKKTGMKMSKISLLKIDRDIHVDRSWIRDYVRTIVAVCKMKGVKVTSIQMCATRKGAHYYVDIQPALLAEAANRLQWLLADDPLRVNYNRARIRSRYADWDKLFERIGQRYTTLYRVKVPAGTRKTKQGGMKRN